MAENALYFPPRYVNSYYNSKGMLRFKGRMSQDFCSVITYLADPLVSRGSELNFVVISVDVRELFLAKVGIVLWGIAL